MNSIADGLLSQYCHAGTDGLAGDALAAYLMGFDPQSIGYLYFCSQDGLGEGDINNLNIIGTPLEECRHSFRTHQSYQAQLGWKKTGKRAFKKLKECLNHRNTSLSGGK